MNRLEYNIIERHINIVILCDITSYMTFTYDYKLM